MNITVTFRKLPSSNALREHAEQKVIKHAKYLHEPVDIHIVLRVEKIRQIAEITVKAKNYRAHAIEESQDMYTSIDGANTKIERQLRKHKELIKNHKTENKVFGALESTIPAAE